MRFRFEQHVECSIDKVFAFFADPGNLSVLHRDDRTFRLLSHAGSVLPGTMTWIELRAGRVLPVVLGFRHVLCDPPRRFVDELEHGPFRRFEHVHEFEPAAGGTIIRDVLDIQLPAWLGGEPAVRRLLAGALRSTFGARGSALARLFS